MARTATRHHVPGGIVVSQVLLEIAVLLVLILANGVFAMSETALLAARRSRLQSWAEPGSGRARAALALAEEPNAFLATVQIGITLVGVLAGAFGGATLALGRSACRAGFAVRCERLSSLLHRIRQAHGEGSWLVLLRGLARVQLLVIDDWLRDPVTASQARDLAEILDDRYQSASTPALLGRHEGRVPAATTLATRLSGHPRVAGVIQRRCAPPSGRIPRNGWPAWSEHPRSCRTVPQSPFPSARARGMAARPPLGAHPCRAWRMRARSDPVRRDAALGGRYLRARPGGPAVGPRAALTHGRAW